MMKKFFCFIVVMVLSSCSTTKGQVVFHWDRYNTGGIKFARDHSECMRKAEAFKFWPSLKSWFYTEEQRYDTVVKWHKDHGIWASFVPYPGAMPVMVNSVRDDSDSSPSKYQKCMLNKGYVERTSDIPEASNLFVYKPQSVNQDVPLDNGTYPK
jgi:hypothetical protein